MSERKMELEVGRKPFLSGSDLRVGVSKITSELAPEEEIYQISSFFLRIWSTIHQKKKMEFKVVNAIKSGINYIDTAPYYGQGKTEIALGKSLKHIPLNTTKVV
ncbi:hypothetical protein NPIL_86061 [Nephila pilipes]|uniref:NADP-dependent oxidoreductase domain-containing protein n=1 Tax=Nephila pilipes TaxID=299642 RepID=A0A8X6QTV0_NEPPI|nr:hypothetical protein NPIL_86061 [Nephila pilipes]